MISAWHLLWIIPVASFVGFMICSILTADKRWLDNEHDY